MLRNPGPQRLRLLAGALVLAVVALLAAACGKNRVLLDVDVRSFMDDSTLVHAYDAPPLVPVSTRLDSIDVNLIEGFKDFGQATSATLDIGVEYVNQTGQGHSRFTLYFSDDPGTTFSTPPVAVIDADLSPGTVTPGSVQIQADPRVLDMFTRKNFWMGVDMEWVPSGTQPLVGTLDITKIQVRLISTLDIFG